MSGCLSFICGGLLLSMGGGHHCAWVLSFVGTGSSFVGTGSFFMGEWGAVHGWQLLFYGCWVLFMGAGLLFRGAGLSFVDSGAHACVVLVFSSPVKSSFFPSK